MSEVDTRYAHIGQSLAMDACDILTLSPYTEMAAVNYDGIPATYPRWMVVAEEMRRFDIYLKMTGVIR